MFKANLSIQKNGSTIILNLRGVESDIVDAFNSLFNWGAVGDLRRGDAGLDFLNHDHSLAECWSTPAKLFRYLYTRHLNAAEDATGLIGEAPLIMRRDAYVAAKKSYSELSSTPFYSNRESLEIDATSEFTTGTDKAEKPDDSFTDYVAGATAANLRE